MKPLLLEFAETVAGENIDTSVIEYNDKLNLNVLRGTTTPAINQANLATQTFTKATGEGTDSDRNMSSNHSIIMMTRTNTRQMIEATDSDAGAKNLRRLMATQTITEVRGEQTDKDK